MTAREIVARLLETDYPVGGDSWKRERDEEQFKEFKRSYNRPQREQDLDRKFRALKMRYPAIDIEPVDEHSAHYYGAKTEGTCYLSFYFYPLFQVGGPSDGVPFPVKEAQRIFNANGIDYDPELGTLSLYANSPDERLAKIGNVFLGKADAPSSPTGQNPLGVELNAYESDTDFQVATANEVPQDDVPDLVPSMDQLRLKLIAEFKRVGTAIGFTNHKVTSTYR